jgi:hypothetical protein
MRTLCWPLTVLLCWSRLCCWSLLLPAGRHAHKHPGARAEDLQQGGDVAACQVTVQFGSILTIAQPSMHAATKQGMQAAWVHTAPLWIN